MKTDNTLIPLSPTRRRMMLALPGGRVLTSPLARVGCGGGGSGDGDNQTVSGFQVQAQMALPAGVKATDVTIVSNASEAQPSDMTVAVTVSL